MRALVLRVHSNSPPLFLRLSAISRQPSSQASQRIRSIKNHQTDDISSVERKRDKVEIMTPGDCDPAKFNYRDKGFIMMGRPEGA